MTHKYDEQFFLQWMRLLNGERYDFYQLKESCTRILAGEQYEHTFFFEAATVQACLLDNDIDEKSVLEYMVSVISTLRRDYSFAKSEVAVRQIEDWCMSDDRLKDYPFYTQQERFLFHKGKAEQCFLHSGVFYKQFNSSNTMLNADDVERVGVGSLKHARTYAPFELQMRYDAVVERKEELRTELRSFSDLFFYS